MANLVDNTHIQHYLTLARGQMAGKDDGLQQMVEYCTCESIRYLCVLSKETPVCFFHLCYFFTRPTNVDWSDESSSQRAYEQEAVVDNSAC